MVHHGQAWCTMVDIVDHDPEEEYTNHGLSDQSAAQPTAATPSPDGSVIDDKIPVVATLNQRRKPSGRSRRSSTKVFTTGMRTKLGMPSTHGMHTRQMPYLRNKK